MMFAGRLAFRMDARYLMGFGVALLLWSLWEMSRWTPEISSQWLIITTFIQGIGMGFVFVPMNLVGFATLPSIYRTDASAVLNLIRNVGMAIGVSITTTVLASSIQVSHAQLAEHATPFNRALTVNGQGMMWNLNMPFGVQQLNAVVERNAEIIAYANDFLFMFFISAPALLVLMFMKKPAMLVPSAREETAAME